MSARSTDGHSPFPHVFPHDPLPILEEGYRRDCPDGLARLKTELGQTLAAAGFLDRIGKDRVYATLPTAVEAYQQWCRTQPPSEDRPEAQ